MSKQKKYNLQPYPRRSGDFLANDQLFPKAPPISENNMEKAINLAFNRIITKKSGKIISPIIHPNELVDICLKHLKERSDPILSPYFLSQIDLNDIFIMDAVSHEMQRHRMKIGEFYQFLVIELMRISFSNVYDGKREGDV